MTHDHSCWRRQPAVILSAFAWVAVASSPTPEQIRRTAEEVFSREEFAPGAGQPNWLLQALQGFFQWLGSLRGASPFLFWAILVACIVLLGILLAWVVVATARVFGHRDYRRRATSGEDGRRERLSATFYDEAQQRAARGEFTEAIRCLFLALVYRFDEKGRVGFQRAWTNREYLALLADDLPARRGLEVFVDTLDEHWYGLRPAGADQYERCQALYERLASAV
jgi:hypothetical protein